MNNSNILKILIDPSYKFNLSENQAKQIVNKYLNIIIDLHLPFSNYEIAKFLCDTEKRNIDPTRWREHIEISKIEISIRNSCIKKPLSERTKKKKLKNSILINYCEFDNYEKEIIDRIQTDFLLSFEESLNIVNKYLCVLYSLNNYHDNPTIYAHRFFEAYNNNYTPEKWIYRIKETQKKYS